MRQATSAVTHTDPAREEQGEEIGADGPARPRRPARPNRGEQPTGSWSTPRQAGTAADPRCSRTRAGLLLNVAEGDERVVSEKTRRRSSRSPPRRRRPPPAGAPGPLRARAEASALRSRAQVIPVLGAVQGNSNCARPLIFPGQAPRLQLHDREYDSRRAAVVTGLLLAACLLTEWAHAGAPDQPLTELPYSPSLDVSSMDFGGRPVR